MILTKNEKFQWIGDGIADQRQKKKNRIRYEAFTLGDLIIRIGDFILVRNDDALDPDDVMNCFVAQVKDLYDIGCEIDPYKAQVQWFSKVFELPTYAIKLFKSVIGHDHEIVKDTRSSWHDVIDAETIFQKCEVLFISADADYESIFSEYSNHPLPVFFCRYQFTGTSVTEVNKNVDKIMTKPIDENLYKNGVASYKDENNHDSDMYKKSKAADTIHNMYSANLIGSPSKCLKVRIRRIDDIIQDKHNGNIRIFVADSAVEKVEDVADIFLSKLKLEKEIESSPESRKRPIIHNLTSQNDYKDTKGELMDYDTTESNDCATPRTRNSSKKLSMPQSNKSCRNLFSTRTSPRKSILKHPNYSPSKKVRVSKIDHLVSPKSGSRKILNSSGEDVESNSKLTNGKDRHENNLKSPQLLKKQSSKNSSRATRSGVLIDSDIESLPSPVKNRKIRGSKKTESPLQEKSRNKKVTESLKKSMKSCPELDNRDACTSPKKKTKLTDVMEDFCLTRSGRRVKAVNYLENEKITNVSTPTKRLPHFVLPISSEDSDSSHFSAAVEDSDDDSSLSDLSLLDEISPSKRKKVLKKNKAAAKRTSIVQAQTPKIRRSVANLCIPERKTPLRTPKNALEESRQRLHVSSVPKSLPCRDEQYSDIYSFVKGCLYAQTGGCMYISGVPGTGKTATVHEVMRNLEEEKESGDVPIFSFVEVNGMWMTDPYQCYVQIFKALTGKTIAPQQAADLLEKRFTERGPKKDAVVLLVDELDRLWTRKQTVMYNIFDWPSKKNSKLIVLAIANTMDLPERMMMNRISSRLGLTRKTFQPYTFRQLQEIIMSRIQALKVFDPDAVQLVARKVAAVSGDARRALDICRFATETAQVGQTSKKGKKVFVGMEHVDKALQQMFSSPVISAIRSSSKIAKIFFQCILSEFTRTGLEETTLLKVHRQVTSVCRFEGLHPPNSTAMSRICVDLAASHLILVDNFRNELYMKIRLNVSSDDVTYALTLK